MIKFFVKGEIMSLGEKIANLRKKNNFSQEDLAERVGVTRQTISKWELNETAPDIMQAKTLSKIFNISLDELTSNDINNVLVQKVSNTERLAGIIIKLLKIFGIGIAVFIIFLFLLFILFRVGNTDREIAGKSRIECALDNEEYVYEIEYNKNYQVINAGGDSFIANHIDILKYDDANVMIAHIEDYFKDHNGSCNTTVE